MAKDNEEKLGRRNFLKMTTSGTAALTAGLIPGSTYAAESKSDRQINASEKPYAKKVKLLFLGTGAADWPGKYPPISKKLVRGQVRGMSSMLVNGHILIDCGPTVLDVMNRYNVNSAGITDILLTHTHSDHFHPDSIVAIADARDATLGPLKFWAGPEALKRVPNSNRIEKCLVEIGKTFQMHGFGITGLEANHLVGTTEEKCLYYFLEGATKNFLYATDGSWLLKRTWLYLQKKRVDALIWDATIGESAGDSRIFEHNDLTMIRHMNETLRKRKIINPETKIILTHMARTLHPPHDQLEKTLLPEGLIPAYDGMSVVLN
ncbi:MAG: MBL fold metallo-hydrolase [Kiritimatiellae bacterium]|jgi:phosphoribosyl 1,2-cyclic phosphate phosphodiesterase|nr:MBL fold metallo-hydrolase [Kiritimatiellia bacterium]